LVTSLCQANQTFLDVGAHIGSIIASVQRSCPSAKIIAVEAVPTKARNLERLFPSVKIFACAVGETTGAVSFFVDSVASARSSLARSNCTHNLSVSEIRIPLRTLDELLGTTRVDVMKLDVEGAELGALRGARNVLNASRPLIMFESGPESGRDLGYTKEALFEFFEATDYAIVLPSRLAHNDPGLCCSGFVESHLYPMRTMNYFAIPRERRRQVRDETRRILGNVDCAAD
jgi:FkbM family methyltransferase